jgi:hypothetical protein
LLAARRSLVAAPHFQRLTKANDGFKGKTPAAELNLLARSVTLDASGSRESDLFELRPSGDTRHDELIGQARAARKAGQVSFQVFAPHAGQRSTEDLAGEFDAPHLVDLLEAEGWMLENSAQAAEYANRYAYGVETPTIVGTIYTFRLTASTSATSRDDVKPPRK